MKGSCVIAKTSDLSETGQNFGCPNGQEKTVGLCNEIMHTCGSFNSQGDAQTWFEANPDYGENIDANGDGKACGEGDHGGLNTCLNSEGVVVLDHLCSTGEHHPHI